MRKYDDNDERAIRTERLVKEWVRSGLLEKVQEDRILPELKVDLRRTNVFLRLIMFGFGLVIIAAFVGLIGVAFNARGEASLAALCFSCAAASIFLSEFLIARFRLYRFGIEEAAAVASGVLVAMGAGILASIPPGRGSGEFPVLVGLVTGSIAGFGIYLRFGYVYAAIASMFCMSAAPFATRFSHVEQRLAAFGFLLLVFVFASLKCRKAGDEFPRDEYSVIRAVACLGMYAYLNLHLASFGFGRMFPLTLAGGPFYWFTYAAIWCIPAAGLFLALRGRDRPLLDVSILLSFVTLATNKPYLGATRQTWDLILLGVFLIGTAVALRRWLSSGERRGFTAARILLSEKERISVVATVSGLLHTVPQPQPDTPAPRDFEPGGGRSGGAGASGSF